jgi:NhaP-type Na+/H+ or K+/H+ antiporter
MCLIVGVVIGPDVTNLVTLHLSQDSQDILMREAARVTVAISVMAAALRLPKGYMRRRARELTTILTAGMMAMWLVSSAVVYIISPVPFLPALLIGAVLTPTDPVLAHSIVGGKLAREHVPARLRHSLTAESGANDGLAILFVMLPLIFLQHPAAQAWHTWFLDALLREVLLATIVGLLAGWAAGKAVAWMRHRPFAEETSLLTVSLSLAFSALAVLAPLNSDGILAAFVAGVVFKQYAEPQAEVRAEHTEEAIGRFFELPVFIIFGLFLPWHGWAELGWSGIAIVIAVLLLRRLPAWFALSPALHSLKGRRDILFNGWFGPIGISALFYASKADHELHQTWPIWEVGSLVVFASTLAYGISATPVVKRFRKPRGEGG